MALRRVPDEVPHEPDIDLEFFGEGQPIGLPVHAEELAPHLRNRRDVDIPQQLKSFQEQIGFKAHHGRWHIAKDLIGLVRREKGADSDESYSDKLHRERSRGKQESSTFGLASAGGQPFVLFAMNWDFFAGSLGVVSGERFLAGADLAISRELPFVAVYASSGVRQHENFAGLTQMTRMVEAIRHYKSEVRAPHVAVLLGNVWGGVSASAVPNADLIIATSGTNFGFAGPNVIEAFEGAAIPTHSQSAEANLLDRNIDCIISDVDELVAYLAELLEVYEAPERSQRLNAETAPMIRNVTVPNQSRVFSFGSPGLHGPRVDHRAALPASVSAPMRPSVDAATPEGLVQRFQGLISDANRIDLDFIVNNAFTESALIYNYVQDGDDLIFPAVAAAIAKLGAQPFLVIGSQPSFRRVGDSVIKRPANPAPEDFEFMERMLDLGERLELPALFVTDTLGAKPTLESERRGQSRAIARLIHRGIDYKLPAISLVTGALGSGGGLATTPMADHVMMLENAMAFVAEPRSAASILYKTPEPTIEQITTTLSTMRATAHDQLELGLIDEVIAEDPNPYVTIERVHRSILLAYVGLTEMSSRRLRARREERIRNLRAFEIIQE
jgi:acetyl-CoA carboxylase carboxyl transferase subunit beta